MRVAVEQVSSHEGRWVVRFFGSCGIASGHWQGDPPEPGDVYDIELSAPSIGTPDATARPAPEVADGAALREEGGRVVLVGQYLALAGGGAGALRLGDDLVLLDGEVAGWDDGARVQVEARHIELYPYAL